MSDRPSRRRVLAGSALLGTTALAGRLPREAAATAAESPNAERTAPGPESQGATETPPASRIARQPPQDLDLEGLESFVDERMDDLLETHDVVGASVAVVHDGTVEHLGGYGEADAEDGTPVDPEETGFRIASVSKPIVWTALMQLIEDGEIDPDEDIRSSLESVSIPETYDEPITAAHLATHTAGFEERARGTWVVDPDDVRPLPDVLAKEQPARVRPPGEVASYSNYGTSLAGQLVADVAGTSFAEYAEANVFDPLEMTSTTFDQPVPEGFDATVATGYTAFAGTTQSVPDLLLEISPAGAATSTAADMAQFLRAHLEGGAIGGGNTGDTGNGAPEESDGSDAERRILAPESVDAMHERWFSHHEAVDGVGFGLIEGERNGVRTLEHDGAIPGSFTSFLVVVPAYDLGLFVATNTNTGALATGDFLDSFFEEYASTTEVEPGDGGEPEADEGALEGNGDTLEPDGSPERAAKLEGTYRAVRVAETSHARLSTTIQAESVDVSVDEDGYLVTDFGGSDRWVEREPLVFEAVDGVDTLAFREGNGGIRYLCLGFHAFERVSRLDSLVTHGGLAAVTTLGMLSGVAAWPLSWAKRRFVDRESPAGVDESTDERGHERETRGAVDDDFDSSDGAQAAEATSGVSVAAGGSGGDLVEGGDGGDNSDENGDGGDVPADNATDESTVDWRSRVTPSPEARPRWIAGGAIACLFGFVFGVVVLAFFVYPYTLFSRPPLVYELLSVLPILGAAGTVVAAGYAVLAWREGDWGDLSRIHYAVVVASMAGFCWLLWYWNFLRIPF
ncbi:serine hydrolase [Natrialba swarupiae]|uniref:Serine hydrolase n=1 Tax=Natrialba swarupiae TaxID=2448032 RepID=A0A5D5ATL5_9EURY|nr:serine hydrolase [Natrialba swarupiae]